MASEAPLGVPTWQVRRMPEKRKPSQPSQRAGRFPRPFLRGQRYRLLHFQPAAERLREAFRLPAAELRSAWLIARTSPAFGARPHGYPSYNPLCATVSLRVRRVNMERLSASYRGNRTCQKEPQESSSKILILGMVSRPLGNQNEELGAVRGEGYCDGARAVRGVWRNRKGLVETRPFPKKSSAA